MGQHFFGNIQVQVTPLRQESKPALPTDYRVIEKDLVHDWDLKRERDQ